jgi:hypothetical protein
MESEIIISHLLTILFASSGQTHAFLHLPEAQFSARLRDVMTLK